MDLVAGDCREPMRRQGDGWWSAASVLPAGADYAFLLDGAGPALPDPRSESQPFGIHGPSRIVDHDAFGWTDAAFRAPPLVSALIYELHVGTFSAAGAFEGVLGHLDHLLELGVTHLQLMPVVEFSGTHGWGYDGVDLYAPHHDYGGPEGLKRLVNGCHERGLAVIVDVVYNHLGPVGNYLERFGPYFSRRHATPWGPAINFDGPDSDEVRRFFVDNALMWLRDYHVDGLRVDAVHAIHDLTPVHFLEDLSRAVHGFAATTGRALALIAESDLNDPRVVHSLDAGGLGMDAQWSDDLHHALHAALTGETSGHYRDFGRLADVAKALRHAFVFDGQISRQRGRRHGQPPLGLPGDRFLGYLQTHDQVGNRAGGERIGHLVGRRRQKIGAALVLTGPFVPMLFQGEEWAASSPFLYFTDHEDEELGSAVRDGRRRDFAAFGWDPSAVPDPQHPDSFSRSTLRWEEVRQAEHAEMLDWYRRLIALRHSWPALTDPRLDLVDVAFDEDAGWLRVRRGNAWVAVNLGLGSVEIPFGSFGTRPAVLLTSGEVIVDDRRVTLAPDGAAILRLAPDGDQGIAIVGEGAASASTAS
jgi:maltooligosyltrehalose trehalohydrolase